MVVTVPRVPYGLKESGALRFGRESREPAKRGAMSMTGPGTPTFSPQRPCDILDMVMQSNWQRFVDRRLDYGHPARTTCPTT